MFLFCAHKKKSFDMDIKRGNIPMKFAFRGNCVVFDSCYLASYKSSMCDILAKISGQWWWRLAILTDQMGKSD